MILIKHWFAGDDCIHLSKTLCDCGIDWSYLNNNLVLCSDKGITGNPTPDLWEMLLETLRQLVTNGIQSKASGHWEPIKHFPWEWHLVHPESQVVAKVKGRVHPNSAFNRNQGRRSWSQWWLFSLVSKSNSADFQLNSHHSVLLNFFCSSSLFVAAA